jgi:carbonic anhydrase/acetyltransferase-like protein (isoleucine patch superfamily)
MPLVSLEGLEPEVADSAWVAPSAVVVGQVRVGDDASIWYGAVLRGDGNSITVGSRSNVQDCCVVHAEPGFPAVIGDGVVVGHSAILHGCTIENDCLIGMGSTVLDGARIGAGSMVAAGAVVLVGTQVPPGSLVADVPAKVRRSLTEEEAATIRAAAELYVERGRQHARATAAGG